MAQTPSDDSPTTRPRWLMTIILAVGLALGAAVIIGIWWLSPVPTFILFTPVLHGMLLGALLRGAFDMNCINSLKARFRIAAAAGVLSLVALFLWQYSSDASRFQKKYAGALRAMDVVATSNTTKLELFDRNVLVPVTGRSGLLGYLDLRYHPGTWRRYVFFVEVAIVIALSAILPVAIHRVEKVE